MVCCPNSYIEPAFEPTRRIRISRSRSGTRPLLSRNPPRRLNRLSSLGWWASTPKMFRGRPSRLRAVDSISSSSDPGSTSSAEIKGRRQEGSSDGSVATLLTIGQLLHAGYGSTTSQPIACRVATGGVPLGVEVDGRDHRRAERPFVMVHRQALGRRAHVDLSSFTRYRGGDRSPGHSPTTTKLPANAEKAVPRLGRHDHRRVEV